MQIGKIVIPILTSFALGSVVGVYLNSLYIVFLIVAFVALAFLLKARLCSYQNIFVVSLCLMFVSIGYFRGVSFASQFSVDPSLESKIDKYIEIEGLIDNNPDLKNGKQVFQLLSNDIVFETTLPKYPLLKYGDEIKVYGKLRRPENFTVTNNKEVRYEAMLRARGVSFILEGKRSELISANNGNYIYASLYSFKRKIGAIISKIESPEGGLLYSMVFGGKNNLDKSIVDYFRIAGLLHIVVLSGQNLTIVAYLTTKVFSNTLGFKIGHILALLSIFAYAIIGGLEAATLRAVFMSSILIILLMFGKVANAGRALFISVIVMTILNPYIVFDDPSFQLSVLAFLGIIYIAPIIQNWLIRNSVGIKLSDYIAAIFGAQLAVMPYILYSSQTFTPYSLLANFLVLAVVGIITVYGILSVFIGLISQLFFEAFTFPLIFALKYIIEIAHSISKLPFSAITLNVNYYFVIIIYICMIYYLFKKWKKEEMAPLNQFILRTETQQLKKGIIPYVEEYETIPVSVEEESINWK